MIRPLVPDDCPSVRALLVGTGNFTAAEAAIADELMDLAAGPVLQSDYYAFVYEDDDVRGDVVGFIVVGPVPATTGTWHLYWIAVDTRRQGSGLAGELQRKAESLVQARGGYWLLAETSSQPGYARARGFYHKYGYRELARIADYYRPSDDMVLYGKRLDAPGERDAAR